MSMYLTLPSNSSADYFPHNRASHFVTKLPQPTELSGEWEVGLAEIQFINTFSNVPDSQVWFNYKKNKDTPRLNDNTGRRDYAECNQKVSLKGGFYDSSEAFIQALNKATEEEDNAVSLSYFRYDFATRKVTLRLPENTSITFSKTLQAILGFKHSFYQGAGKFLAEEMVDVNQDYKSMFIYCDLVTPRPVGDVMVPLLRTLPIGEQKRKVIHVTFDRPHYIPLSRFQFETVEILITSDLGQEL